MDARSQGGLQRNAYFDQLAGQGDRQGNAVRAVHLLVAGKSQRVTRRPGGGAAVADAPRFADRCTGGHDVAIGDRYIGDENSLVYRANWFDLDLRRENIAEVFIGRRDTLPGRAVAAGCGGRDQLEGQVGRVTGGGVGQWQGCRPPHRVVAQERQPVALTPRRGAGVANLPYLGELCPGRQTGAGGDGHVGDLFGVIARLAGQGDDAQLGE